MPNYNLKELHMFQHPLPSKPQHAPHKWNKAIYGTMRKYAQNDTSIPKLTPPSVKNMQKNVGTLLYYALALDNTMLVSLGYLSFTQSKPIKEKWEKSCVARIM